MGASSAIQSRRSSQRRHEVNDALLTKRGSGYARDVVAIPGGLTAAHDRSWRDVIDPRPRHDAQPTSASTCTLARRTRLARNLPPQDRTALRRLGDGREADPPRPGGGVTARLS
jgi:hypothetical protein